MLEEAEEGMGLGGGRYGTRLRTNREALRLESRKRG
jgi:hypothetical protein